jgi:hypothetical protein
LQEILDLTPLEQRELLDVLTHHAMCGMRRKWRWRGIRIYKDGQAIAGGRDCRDFAMEAISRALSGKRKWNKAKYATLVDFLRGAIDSILSSAVREAENKETRIVSSPDPDVITFVDTPSEDPQPVQILIDRGWRQQFGVFRDESVKELEDDPQLSELFSCLESGQTAPSEISLLLGITAQDVTNLKKRLARKLEKLEMNILRPQEKVKK